MEARLENAGRLLDLFLMFLKFRVMHKEQIQQAMIDLGHHVSWKTTRRDLVVISERKDCTLERYDRGHRTWWRLKEINISEYNLPACLPDKKECRDCHIVFHGRQEINDSFHNNRNLFDGKAPRCKKCDSIRSKDEYLVKKEFRIKQMKEHRAKIRRREERDAHNTNRWKSQRSLATSTSGNSRSV